MRKKVRFFHQHRFPNHTMETCGAACLLMVLDYYRKVQYPTKKMELKLYKLYKSRVFKGMPASYAADALAWNGLQVQLLHSSPRMMENRDGYYEWDLYQALWREYCARAEACKNRVEIRTDLDLDTEYLKALLDEGKLVMVQCIVPGDADGIHTEVLHWVLAYGWEAGEFLLCDPAYGKVRIPEEEMAVYLDTPIGRIFLAVKE